MKKYKQLYECLLETEELHKMFPKLSGDWEQDKNKFIQYQQDLESLANVIDTDIDEE